jgi:hypothetical protein
MIQECLPFGVMGEMIIPQHKTETRTLFQHDEASSLSRQTRQLETQQMMIRRQQ